MRAYVHHVTLAFVAFLTGFLIPGPGPERSTLPRFGSTEILTRESVPWDVEEEWEIGLSAADASFSVTHLWKACFATSLLCQLGPGTSFAQMSTRGQFILIFLLLRTSGCRLAGVQGLARPSYPSSGRGCTACEVMGKPRRAGFGAFCLVGKLGISHLGTTHRRNGLQPEQPPHEHTVLRSTLSGMSLVAERDGGRASLVFSAGTETMGWESPLLVCAYGSYACSPSALLRVNLSSYPLRWVLPHGHFTAVLDQVSAHVPARG